MSPAPRRQSLSDIFLYPALIGALCLIGLVSALVGDGVPDIIAWAGLAAPVIAVAWARTRRRPKPQQTSPQDEK